MTALPKPTREELQNEVTLTETMAQQSEAYARRIPGQKNGALTARARATAAKARLAQFDALTQPIGEPPAIEVLLSYNKLAGDVANLSFMFRCGEVDEATQKAASAKLACIARDVRRLERFVQEASDNADDQPQGVPYNGKPTDV